MDELIVSFLYRRLTTEVVQYIVVFYFSSAYNGWSVWCELSSELRYYGSNIMELLMIYFIRITVWPLGKKVIVSPVRRIIFSVKQILKIVKCNSRDLILLCLSR